MLSAGTRVSALRGGSNTLIIVRIVARLHRPLVRALTNSVYWSAVVLTLSFIGLSFPSMDMNYLPTSTVVQAIPRSRLEAHLVKRGGPAYTDFLKGKKLYRKRDLLPAYT